jgi:hypothetical protein
VVGIQPLSMIELHSSMATVAPLHPEVSDHGNSRQLSILRKFLEMLQYHAGSCESLRGSAAAASVPENGLSVLEVTLECSLTVGPTRGIRNREKWRWYPYWFMACFLLDVAEVLEKEFTNAFSKEEVAAEVHQLCVHSVHVLASGCLGSYRFVSHRFGSNFLRAEQLPRHR